MSERQRLLPRLIARALAWLSRFCFERPVAVLAAVAVMLGLSLVAARRLKMDTDLSHLLPNSFDSVRSLSLLEERGFSAGYISLVASGGDEATLKRFADEVAPQVEKLSTIQYVDYRRPTEFFRKRALLYMDVADLHTIRDRIEAKRQWEVRQRSELYDLGLDDNEDEADKEKAPTLNFDDLKAKYEKRLGRGSGGSSEDYFIDSDAKMLVLLAKPARRSSDVGFSKAVVKEVKGFIAGLDVSRYPGVSVEISGRHKKKIDQQRQIEGDLKFASLVSLALVILYLAFHFRRIRAVLFVLAPLVTGILWSFGAAGVVFGKLNLLSGFIGAILVGLGIDHGIHLLSRYEEELNGGAEPSAAIERAFSSTGRAVLVAALTTTFGFVGVSISKFAAFHEFGAIAAMGTILLVVAYTVVLPPLVALLGKRAPKKSSATATAKKPSWLSRWAPATFWVSLVAGVAALSFVGENRFDYDFASLEDSQLPAFQLDKKINRVLGRSQTPLVAIPDDIAHEAAITSALRGRKAPAGQHSTVQSVLGLSDLVPAGQQARYQAMQEIHETTTGVNPKWLDETARKQRQELLDLATAKPFARRDLPEQVLRQFYLTKDDAGLVLIYPAVSLSDGDGVARLASELRGLTTKDGRKLTIAGEALVLADVLTLVKSEAPVIMGITLVLVLLVMLLTLDSLMMVVACFAVAMGTLLVTAGLMPRSGLRFNYLDIVMVPVLFGIAVDGAVHFLTEYRQRGDIGATLGHTGRAVAGATLTTSLGFGALTIANHPGLASLGTLALLGLAVNTIVCLVTLPSALALPLRGMQRAAIVGSKRWAELGATVGLAGFAPIGSGTVGALIAIPLAVAVGFLPLAGRAAVVVLVVVACHVATHYYLQDAGDHDPSEVVADELAGCLIAISLVPQQPLWVLAAFVMFRIFDIFKPWPVSYFDKHVKGAWGVMGDDVVAGLMAGFGLAAVNLWWFGA